MVQSPMLDNVPRKTGDTRERLLELAESAVLAKGFAATSIDELNRRLANSGEPAVTLARFRPNLVLGGLDANGEDHLDEIVFAAAAGPVRLKLVKPCVRCSIPDVDPADGTAGHAVGDALSHYRGDPRMGGAITFAMNGVIVEGMDCTLTTGMRGTASYAFA